MIKRLAILVAVLAVLGAAAALAVDTQPTKIPRTVPAPAGVKIRNELQFKSVGPGVSLTSVSIANRLPFLCQQSWDSFWHKANVFVWYTGASAVQTQKLRVHWSLQGCCENTVGAPTTNYLLYKDQGFAVYDGVPPNLNMPPEGQPLLTCTAYGWLVP